MPNHRHPNCLRLTIGLAGLAMVTPGASSAQTGPPEGAQWAVLIAVQQHDNPRYNLQFARRDVALMRSVLADRAGVAADHVLELSDRPEASGPPRLGEVRRRLPEFLARSRPSDRIVVYVTSHGFREGERSFLVLADTRDAASGLPAAELRQMLAAAPASIKFLILDACHSGGAKAVPIDEPSAESLAKSIVREPLAGTVVLASSRDDQSSWEWGERHQSVFTYWLARALEGGADSNGDGQITADEVYRYTHERVVTTTRQVFAAEQTPVRLIGGDVAGVPVLLTLLPEPPETLCRRLAEQLDLEVRRHQLKQVGVFEFLEPLGRAEALASANLPGYCADRIRVALVELAGGAYSVAGPEVGKGMQVEALGDPAAMRALGTLDGVVVGTLRRRGRNLNVQCDLVAVATGESLATPSGMLPLSEEVLADNGSSFANGGRPPGGPYDPVVLAHAQERARQGHPLLDPAFPFRVEVWAIDAAPGAEVTPATPRHRKAFLAMQAAGDEAPNQLLVPAREGELFEIRVWNNSPNRVALTLLVDGLNTLGQNRERLGQAWSWVVEPTRQTDRPPDSRPPFYAVEGWYLPKGPGAVPGRAADFTMRRFRFTGVAQSVAGRQNFGESIGLITAAFYAERGRGLGVGEGPAEARPLRTAGFQPGRLLGVVQIRYADERDLENR